MSEQQEAGEGSEPQQQQQQQQQQQPKVPRNNNGPKTSNPKGPRMNQKPYSGNQGTHPSNNNGNNGNNNSNNNRYNKNGHYKNNRNNAPHSGNMQNMQWGYGSYNMAAQPQFYPSYGYGYMPPMAGQGYNPATATATPNTGASAAAPSGSASPVENAATPLASSTTPVSKKIEITNRSGEHVDLNAIHSQHVSSVGSPNPMPQSPKKEPTPVPSSVTLEIAAPVPSTPEPQPEPPKEPSADELLKMRFLEQVRLRKAMRAQKKTGETPQAAPTQETAPEAAKPSTSEPIETVVEEAPKAQEAPKVEAEAPKAEEASKAEEGSKVEEATDTKSADLEEKLPENANEEQVTSTEETHDPKSEVESQQKPELKPESEAQPIHDDTVEKSEPVEEEASLEPAKPLTFAEKLRLKNKIPAKTEAIEPEGSTEQAATEPAMSEDEMKESANTEEPLKVEESVQIEEPAIASPAIEEAEPNADEPTEQAETSTEAKEEHIEEGADELKKSAEEEQDAADVDDGRMTMTELLSKLDEMKPVDDVYSFEYPEGIEAPDARHKKDSVKYTYGPTFLLQFQDKVNIRPDAEWRKNVASKIVIPPGTVRQGGRARGDSKFGPGANFKKSGSMRGMDGRSNSRSNSKRKSKKMGDDRKSNRAYTSRKDREKMAEEEALKALEEAAPLIPSANRWVPKSKQKKVEKKLAPDGVTELLEKEEAERKMKSLLNKLTLEKFDSISDEIIAIADQSKWETDCVTLKVVIEEIFLKACDEPHWSSMYAQLCGKVVKDMDPEIKEEGNEGKTGPKLVLHYLVDRCHAEFQKGWSDKLPTKEDGSPLEPEMMSDEYYKMAAAKRRGLGLVRLIGFLYRSHLLTAKMMFECFRRLMKDLADSPTEETLESVLELLNTVGEQFEGDRLVQQSGSLEGSTVLDQLFYMLDKVTEGNEISSRIKFKLIDMKELREVKNWNNAKGDEGPKTIQQIHEEEAAKKAMEERERKYKGSSRSGSRRNNSNTSMGNRSNSRREPVSATKDSFISTRSSSLRHVQNAAKEETPQKKSAVNMFDALMGAESDDDE
ncbi:LANO_0D08152g1_1 [Lachancea nothofagi CBS 11611]|uniref:LANO_0D08152g1_1 n=1 Tax=Lachancea nothofagi CBS 11611 TaxID=1266666 RepID=A0A1G4JIQ0_9SACH|nr:LANO_0D08152g1_1 [Lachancea nothofagi CBS 11611]